MCILSVVIENENVRISVVIENENVRISVVIENENVRISPGANSFWTRGSSPSLPDSSMHSMRKTMLTGSSRPNF